MGFFESATFWTALGSTAAAVATAFLIYQHFRIPRRKRRMRIFLSMQMSQLTPEQYRSTRSEVMELVGVLRRSDDIYFLNELIPQLENFKEESFDVRNYLNELSKADYFVAIVTEPICSSIYFEAGFALALGKPSIYFVTEPKVMPSLMRILGVDHPRIKTVLAQSLAEICPRISKLLAYEKMH
jgi:hypothetical protein